MSYTLYVYRTLVNYTRGNTGRKYIVIHYTGNRTDTAKGNASYFRNVNRGASAHYFVDQTSVYEVVSPDNTAWAVGRKFGAAPYWGKCTNSNSISIEMCSNGGKIADATFANTVELTKSLMEKYGIPGGNVIRHYDVCAKACPGWDGWIPKNETLWKKFLSQLKESEGPATKGEEEEMQCTFQIDGKPAVYWFDGQKIRALTNADQLKVLQNIYQANNGKKLPHFKWTSTAPWYLRLQQAINRPEVHFDEVFPS